MCEPVSITAGLTKGADWNNVFHHPVLHSTCAAITPNLCFSAFVIRNGGVEQRLIAYLPLRGIPTGDMFDWPLL